MKKIFFFGINFSFKSLYVIGLLYLFKNDNYAISLISYALIYSYLAPILDIGLGIQLRNKFANNLETKQLIYEYKSLISLLFLVIILIITIVLLINLKFAIMASYVLLLAISLMIDTFYVTSNKANKIINVEIIIYSTLYLFILLFFKFIVGDLLVLLFFIPLLVKVLYYFVNNFELNFNFFKIFKIFSSNQFFSQLLASFISIIPLAILKKNYSLFFVEIFLFVRFSNLFIALSSQYINFYPLLVIDKLKYKFSRILKYTFYIEFLIILITSFVFSFFILKDTYFILPFLFYYTSSLFINIKSTILQYLNIKFPVNIYITWIVLLSIWFILESSNIKLPIFLILISTLILFFFNNKINTTLIKNESL